mmetsp:Transcript_52231/g.131273  ORF Transcript_52231/g.131273 Transcript_52231/m.131273 type:complete len:243 (-) Transcript_52231:383-1111(-)
MQKLHSADHSFYLCGIAAVGSGGCGCDAHAQRRRRLSLSLSRTQAQRCHRLEGSPLAIRQCGIIRSHGVTSPRGRTTPRARTQRAETTHTPQASIRKTTQERKANEPPAVTHTPTRMQTRLSVCLSVCPSASLTPLRSAGCPDHSLLAVGELDERVTGLGLVGEFLLLLLLPVGERLELAPSALPELLLTRPLLLVGAQRLLVLVGRQTPRHVHALALHLILLAVLAAAAGGCRRDGLPHCW